MPFLDHEAAIIARLRDRCAAPVATIRGLDDLRAYRGPSPALFVGYDSGDLDESNGRAALITQRWLVLALARNVAGDSDDEARAVASDLVDSVLTALMGYRYSEQAHLMTLARLDEAVYAAGYIIVPLVFETRQRITQPMTD